MRTSTKARERQCEELLSDLDNQVWKDAKNRWWVSELLAKDCEEAWIHTGEEDTLAEMVRMFRAHEEER